MRTMTTIPGAARYFQDKCRFSAITAWGIRQLLLDGKIPYTRRGRRYIIAVEDVEKAYNEQAARTTDGEAHE